MKVFKLSFLFLLGALFPAACSQSEVADRVYNPQNQPYEIGRVDEGFLADDELTGQDGLDLQALGALLERANNAEDFEYLLNSEQGINNLDLNDDGYVDYISVREFDDRYDDERGFSLFSMFGDNLIQEIATIFFDRNGYDDGNYYPGSRVLIRGNDYLYGDNYYYETNWNEREIPFIDWVFSDRDDYYRSPYYYQNYPSYYEPYQIVETPVYLTRVEQYYYSPVFVQTTQPTITEIRVESPYRDVSLSQAYMKAPKEQREQRRQRVIVERTQQRAQFERERREKPERMKQLAMRENRQNLKDSPNRPGRPERVENERPPAMREIRERPNKPERADRQPPQRVERQQQQQQRIERQQQRVERQQQRPQQQRQQQQRVERPQQVNQPKQQRPENRVQPRGNGGGGKQNPGGGGNNRGGGGNGGGKGKGKP